MYVKLKAANKVQSMVDITSVQWGMGVGGGSIFPNFLPPPPILLLAYCMLCAVGFVVD